MIQSIDNKNHGSYSRISGLIFRISGLLFVIAGILMIVFVNLQMRQHALSTAEQKARIILDRNYATHTYFSQQLKPAIFKLTDPITSDAYFDPVWMSSTFVVRQIDAYFQSMSPTSYYYKECAINARSPANEADTYEREFLKAVNAQGSEFIKRADVRDFNGKPFYAVLRRAEVMEKSCLRCHGNPDNAPEQLIEMYGAERSFHRELGEVVSAVSIRIPLASAYASANRLSMILSGFLVAVLLLVHVLQHLVNRRYIYRPLAAVENQVQRITNNEEYLGKEIKLPAGRELRSLTAAFNSMSRRLRYYIDNLDHLVKDRTRQLSETNEVLAVEIEAHKKAEKELSIERKWLFTTLRSIGEGVITTDTAGRIVLMNQVAEMLTGWDAVDVIGQPLGRVFKIINELTREPCENPVEHVLATGKVVGIANHTVLINKYGLEIPIKDSGAPVVMQGGKTIGVVLVFRDNSLERVAELELRESEERYRLLAENTVDCIWTMNLDTVFTYINPAIETVTGYKPEEWIGTSLADHCDEKNLQKVMGEIIRGMDALPEIKNAQFEATIKHRDGSPVDVEIAGKILLNDKMEPVALQGIARDITERKKLEARLLQSHKIEAIGTLAGGIAHDFNNILSSIIGYTELVLEDLEKGSLAEENLSEVYKAGIRAKQLVKQILTFARKTGDETKPIQVSVIVKEALKLLRSSIPATIEIRQDIVSDSLIEGTPTQIHQIIMNLCTNAAQAMEDTGGILSVGLSEVTLDKKFISKYIALRPGRYLKITVSDTGPGVSPHIIDSIFEPYFTTKALGEGTGMGLAMVDGIVKQHQGEILVKNRHDKGAEFIVYLPVTEKNNANEVFNPEVVAGGKEKILFIDDEPSIAKMIWRALDGLGYTVTTRTSSIEALKLFQSMPEAFDLVITDMTMPQMTGDQLAIELLSIRPDIPIILCTGYNKTISWHSAKIIGIRALVYKPIAKWEVAKTIRDVLDNKK